MSAEKTNDIENRFAFHAATTEEKKNEHSSARNSIKTVAHYLNSIVPEGREKAVMLTKLEEAMFWANAAIARNNG